MQSLFPATIKEILPIVAALKDGSDGNSKLVKARKEAHQAFTVVDFKIKFFRCGTQAIIAWAIDKEPDAHDFRKDSYRLYYSLKNTGQKRMKRKVSRAER